MVLVEISSDALVTSRVEATIELDGLAQPRDRDVEIVLDLPIGFGEALVERNCQVALGHTGKTVGQCLDGAGLLRRSSRFLGLDLATLGFGRRAFGIGSLALFLGLGIGTQFLDCGGFETEEGAGKIADFIHAFDTVEFGVQIAGRKLHHDEPHAVHQQDDRAVDKKRSGSSHDDRDHGDEDKQIDIQALDAFHQTLSLMLMPGVILFEIVQPIVQIDARFPIDVIVAI